MCLEQEDRRDKESEIASPVENVRRGIFLFAYTYNFLQNAKYTGRYFPHVVFYSSICIIKRYSRNMMLYKPSVKYLEPLKIVP